MDVAAAGTSMMFFLLTAMQVLLGLITLTYVAHSFLVVLIETAAGTDKVVWPDEPFQDWLWKPWYLAWLVAVWAVPAALILEGTRLSVWMIRLLGIGFVWLSLPIALLSSLSASSRMVIFRPLILKQLASHFGSTVAFFAVTWLLVPGCAALVYAVFVRSEALVLLAVPIALAAGVLLYARLLGRLAWVLNQRTLGQRRSEAAEAEEETEADDEPVDDPWAGPEEESAPRERRRGAEDRPRRSKKSKAPPPTVADPWLAPPLQKEPEIDWRAGLPADVVEQGIYGVHEAAPPPPPPPPALENDTPLELQPALPPPRAQDRKEDKDAPELSKVSEYELALAQRHREPPPPPWPMISGVYSFLGYRDTLGPLFTMALGFFLMALLLKGQQIFLPF